MPDGSGDAPTVQAGLDSAQAGDDVLLGAGTYTWTSESASGQSMIRMKRDVTLHSEAGAAATVLDAEQRGRVVECVDVGSARIEGLTITGGQLNVGFSTGGGINSTGDSQLAISSCVIQRNDAFGDQANGGGIYCVGGSVVGCEILDNRAEGEHGNAGGIACRNTLVSDCTIRGNRSRGGDGYSDAGGISAIGGMIVDSRIEANVNAGSYFGGSGGGISLGAGTLLRCVIIGNRLQGQRSTYGGGLYCSGSTITDCVFLANYVIGYGFPTSFWGGGAIASRSDSQPNTISGCTIAGNVAEQSFAIGIAPVGGLALESGGTVSRTIIASNTGAACYGAANFDCMNLHGNSGGDALCGTDNGGNFSADPQFCATDPAVSFNVTIQSDSPCAPSNHPSGNACGLIGAGSIGCDTIAVEQRTWSGVKNLYR